MNPVKGFYNLLFAPIIELYIVIGAASRKQVSVIWTNIDPVCPLCTNR